MKILARESMIRLDKIGSRTTSRQLSGLITVCNYDKFQQASLSVRHKPVQVEQKSFEFPASWASEPNNQGNIISLEFGKRRKTPFQGARSKNGAVVWFNYGTDEWLAYIKDHHESTGEMLPPENYADGGRGNWFSWLGQMKENK